ncbi:MAG: hypothetical protein ACJ73L_03130 [Actinomycetes bacterium]
MHAPDDSPCWAGNWSAPDGKRAIWAQSAVARTVSALPELHPLRLGDDKGTSGRVMTWCATSDQEAGGLGVLTQLSPPPDIGSDYTSRDSEPFGDVQWDSPATTLWADEGLLSTLVTALPRETADAIADAVAPQTSADTTHTYQEPAPGVRRWAGALAEIPGAWLPPVAILPRAGRGIDDPGTSWSTESLDFASRHSVHAKDVRLAADLLAPHVTALILDHVGDEAAVTIYGDAVHIWWPYDEKSRHTPGSVIRSLEVAVQLSQAFPSFVLAEYPDHSDQVEDRLAARAAEAAAYRAARDARLKARAGSRPT